MSAPLQDLLLRCLVRVDGAEGELPGALGRAEAALRAGRVPEALAAARAARGEDRAAAAFLESAALLALGRPAEAESAARAAARLPAAAAALRALARASLGRAAEARAELARAARLAPRRAWPWVLTASLLESARDLAGADAALGRAAAAENRAWIHAERARVRERLGRLPDAIASAAAGLAVEDGAALRLLKGELHERWREHALAAAEYARAAALAPEDAGAPLKRAHALSAMGRFADARAAAAEAQERAPGDDGLRAWRLQLDLVSGRAAAAEAELARLRRASASASLRASARYLEGYALLRRRRWTQARRAFAALSAPGASDAFRRKASFYAAVAAALEDGGPKRPRERLLLAGLGVNPPYTATAEAVRALAGCRTLFNNVMGDEMFEFLRALCPEVRPVAYHQNGDEPRLAAEMLAAARGEPPAAFVTRGSAIVYGPLGTLMLARAAKSRLSARVLASVSSAELFETRAGRAGGASPGYGVLDSSVAAAPEALTDARAPLTVYLSFDRGEASVRRAFAALSASRGTDAPVEVYDHVVGQEPLAWTAGELASRRGELSDSAIVRLPGRRP